MKKIMILMLTVSTLAILTSCGNYKDIQEELLSYYNEEWIAVSEVNKKGTHKLLDVISERGEEDEEAIIVREEEIIPAEKEAMDRLKSLQLEYKQVKKLNELQIKIIELEIDSDIGSNDYIRGDIKNSELQEKWNELRDKRDEFDDYLEKLMKKYDLEYENGLLTTIK